MQYLVKDVTERQLIHVRDEEADAYRDQGWTDASQQDIDTWRRNDPYQGLQGHPPPPPLPAPAIPVAEQTAGQPTAPALSEEDRAKARVEAQTETEIDAATRLVPHTPPAADVAPTHPPLTEGEPAPGSSLAQAQAGGQLPAEAVSGDLSVPEQGDAAAVPGPGGATVFGAADQASSPPQTEASTTPASTGLFGAPADPARDTDADEAPATDEHTV